ncbi:MAG: hypothetical protein J6K65_09960 [Alphaproteobacteria bacterium]|nr:hypothetical protein [Alphaproteobacteria bacterium]
MKIFFRIITFLVLALILFTHLCLFNEGILFNPIVLCLIVYSAILFFKQLHFNDMIFFSKFSLFFLFILSFAVVLNDMINIDNGYLFIVNSFYVFLFGAVWALNKPYLNLEILQNRFGKNNIIGSILYYFVAGISLLAIGVFSAAVMYSKEKVGMNFNNSFKTVLQLGVVLLCLQGGILFFASLASIFCMFLSYNKTQISFSSQLPEILDDKTEQNKIYKILVAFCGAYIVILVFNGYSQLGNQILWNIPAVCFTLFLFYKLSLQKYNYKHTVSISNTDLYLLGGLLFLSTLGIYFYSRNNTFSYNVNSFMQNIILWKTYNNDFSISLNVLLFITTGMLLSLNNITNSANFYIRIFNLKYSPLHMAISLVVFIAIAIYALFYEIQNKSISNIKTYPLLMILLIFVSQITFRFVGFYIKELSIPKIMKGDKHV